MKIEIPKGALIMDDVKHQYYRLNEDGSKTFMPYLDTNTGKVINPPTQPSTEP